MAYCTIQQIRDEGFTEELFPDATDARISYLIQLATRYIDKVTRRFFEPRSFDDDDPFTMDGSGARVLQLPIPIISLSRLRLENQGLLETDLIDIELSAVRVYNRHLRGQTYPDDREDSKVSFIHTKVIEVVATGIFPHPRIFPLGRQNVQLSGVFGYTDYDGVTPEGITPPLISQAACRLVQRDLLLDSDACEKFAMKEKFRITMDKQGSTTIKLQDIWLKGAFTGDKEIDNILMMYRAPMNILSA